MKGYKNILDILCVISGLGGVIIWIIGISKKSTDIDLSDTLRFYGMLLLLVSGFINWYLRFIQKQARKRIKKDQNNIINL